MGWQKLEQMPGGFDFAKGPGSGRSQEAPGFEAPQLVRGRAAKQKPAGALNGEPVSAEAMSERQQMAYLMKLTAMEPAASQLEQVGEAGRAKKRSRPARSEADKPDAGQKRARSPKPPADKMKQWIEQYSQEAVDEATKPKGSWDEMLGRLREWQVGWLEGWGLTGWGSG